MKVALVFTWRDLLCLIECSSETVCKVERKVRNGEVSGLDLKSCPRGLSRGELVRTGSIHLYTQDRYIPNGVQMEVSQISRKWKWFRGEEGKSFPGEACGPEYAWALSRVRGRLTEEFWVL